MVETLTPRQRQVVVLIGGRRLSYKAAARQLANLQADDGSQISPHTVREYCREIRELLGSDLAPRDALTELYWSYPKLFEAV